MAVLSIAYLTLQDLFRRRLLVVLLVFALGMILLSFPLTSLTIGDWRRLIVDVGVGATDLSVALLALFLGAGLISGELDKRSLYPLLARPIARYEFVAGKFLGLVGMVVFFSVAMGGGTGLILVVAREQGFLPLAQAVAGVAATGILVGAIAVLFSSFTNTTLAGIFALSGFILGHLTDNMAYFGARARVAWIRDVMVGAAKVLPSLDRMNLKTLAAHGTAIPWTEFGIRISYGLLYSVVLVAFAALLFSRRDLK